MKAKLVESNGRKIAITSVGIFNLDEIAFIADVFNTLELEDVGRTVQTKSVPTILVRRGSRGTRAYNLSEDDFITLITELQENQ